MAWQIVCLAVCAVCTAVQCAWQCAVHWQISLQCSGLLGRLNWLLFVYLGFCICQCFVTNIKATNMQGNLLVCSGLLGRLCAVCSVQWSGWQTAKCKQILFCSLLEKSERYIRFTFHFFILQSTAALCWEANLIWEIYLHWMLCSIATARSGEFLN